MFSTEISYRHRYTYAEHFIGKWLFFVMIALLQALILSLGNIFLLKAYVVAPVTFVLTSLLIALTRSTIVFTLVKVFWNIGKVLGVVLLVLQLTGSGWSFPVDLSPKFFQNISPFLPFSYAIASLREVVWGIIRDIYRANIYVLVGITIIMIILGLGVGPYTQEWVKRMSAKLNSTGLTPH